MRRVAVCAIALGIAVLMELSGCQSSGAGLSSDLSNAQWLIAGPLANAGDQGLSKDYLSLLGGEANAQPHRGDALAGTAWTEVRAQDGHIDLLTLYPASTDTVAYAYTEITAQSEGPAALKLGSDDGIKAWLNGSLVWENHVHRALQRDEDAVSVTLSKGKNRLLVKVEQASGSWEFTARLRPAAEEKAEWAARTTRGLRILLPQQSVAQDTSVSCCVTTLPAYAVELPVQLSVSDLTGKEVGSSACKTGQWTTVPLPAHAQGAFLVRAKAAGLEDATTSVLVGENGAIYDQAAALARSAKTSADQPSATLAFLADELQGKIDSSLCTPDRDIRAIQTIQEIAAALNKGPWKPDLFKGQRQWAYRSPIDGSLQPYTVYLPAGYDPAKKYPLIVALHGYTDNDWNTAHNLAVYEPQNYVIAAPYERGDVGYRTAAEQDVLDVLDLVESLYSIDTDRVYLAGWSMGGMGTWRIGELYTDRFAAIAPFCGWSGTQYAENLKNTPIHVVHGDADTSVPVGMDRTMVAKLKEIGATVEYHEIPGGTHDTWSQAVLDRAKINVFEFFDKYKRNPWPAKIDLNVDNVRYGRHFWVRVDEISTPPEMGHLDAEVKDTTHVRVQTKQIVAFALDLRHPQLSQTGEVSVSIDGTDVATVAGTAPAYFVKEAGGAWRQGPAPRSDLARHTGDGVFGLFEGPVTVVYGTLKPERTQLLRAVAQVVTNWAPTSQMPVGMRTGSFRVTSDTEVTQADLTGGNLLLIGDQSENRLTARQLAFAHIDLGAGSVSVAGQNAKGTGLLATFPNAHAPRYVATVLTIPSGQQDVESIVFYAEIGMRAYNVDETATAALGSCDIAVFSDLNAILGRAPAWIGFYDRNWDKLNTVTR